MMRDFDTLSACYAAFLGKVIGVRLGAPVENWSAARIAAHHPNLNGYPVDYGVFAADDDTNGPAFFVRALLDDPRGTPLADAVARAALNYIPDHDGFFWWGGSGVSTEQTAYENLTAGIRPPESGSIARNGRTAAEQIGGQIFSDCWGYVALSDPGRAADLAQSAACVTHDGEALQGARFIAACIAIAAQERTARGVIEQALCWIDEKSEYARMVRAVCAFYERAPQDWRACLAWIERRYETERYGGVCHIIPNAARIVLALCYGENDFTKTLLICCQSGFDTDCNCGNVGSIMGALCGIDGIPERWIRPVNDILICSSCLGYRNNATVSGAARLFANLAEAVRAGADCTLVREEYDWRFALPYETKGAVADGGLVCQSGGALRWLAPTAGARLFWRAYFPPEELYDARYEPALSPLLYPGGTVGFTVSAEEATVCEAYAETDAGEAFFGARSTVRDATRLSVTVPSGGGTVLRFGLRVLQGVQGAILVHAATFDQSADCSVHFADWRTDDYGPRFSGGNHRVIRGFAVHSGEWRPAGGALTGRSAREALMTTGSARFALRKIAVSMTPRGGCGCFIAFSVRGARRFLACGVRQGRLVLMERRDEETAVLFERELPLQQAETIRLSVCAEGRELVAAVGGAAYRCRLPDGRAVPEGAVGLFLQGAGDCAFHTLAYQAGAPQETDVRSGRTGG